MFGAISEKFRAFTCGLNLRFHQFFTFYGGWGEFFFHLSKLRNFYHFINQLVRETENFLGISRQSLQCQSLFHFCRNTCCHAIIRNIRANNRACCNHTVITDSTSRKNYHSSTYPDIIADSYLLMNWRIYFTQLIIWSIRIRIRCE